MSWKARVGSIAGKLGLDGDAVVATALRTAQAAANGAKKVADQALPAAQRVAGQLQSAATSMVDDFRAGMGRRQAKPAQIGSTAEAPTAPKRARARREPTVASTTPVRLQIERQAAFDTNGTGLSLEDAAELARIPKDLYGAIVVARYGNGVPSTELAEQTRRYVADTSPGIIGVASKASAHASVIAERSGIEYGQLNALWDNLKAAALVLAQYDAVHGTDFAASAWLAMLEKWTPASLPDPRHVDEALGVAIDRVAASPRSETHAATLFDRLATFQHADGWPTSMFARSDQLAKLWAIARSAADKPDAGHAVAATLGRFTQAALTAPISDREWGEGRMHPLVLRVEIGFGAGTVLKELGSPIASEIGERAFALVNDPEAKPSNADITELAAIPRALTSSDEPLTPEATAHLRAWVDSVQGDPAARSLRYSAYAATPLTRMLLCNQLAVTPAELLDAVSLSHHLERARERLATPASSEENGASASASRRVDTGYAITDAL